VSRYDLVLQFLKDVPYARWRDFSPEDTLRFYGPRLQEVGMIQSSPQKLVARYRLAIPQRAKREPEGIEGGAVEQVGAHRVPKSQAPNVALEATGHSRLFV
jgi:hypothetical protein